MLGLLTRLVGGAVQPLVDQVSDFSARLLRKVALFLVAAICMVVVVIALTIAFFLWLASVASPIIAALSVAGFYLTIAIIAVVLALRDGTPDKEPAEAKGDSTAEAEAKARAAGLDAQIDQFTAPLMGFLSQFGLRREQFAVMAGASVAKQLGPLPLVGLAIVGGFLLGRLFKSWRALPEIVAGLASSGLFGFATPESKQAHEMKDDPTDA